LKGGTGRNCLRSGIRLQDAGNAGAVDVVATFAVSPA
jgi:hypothetical protein